MVASQKYLLFICLFLFACNPKDYLKLPSEFTAKVIAVKDGDTIEVLYDGKPIKIRFAHIDCPEIRKSQPFGRAAKHFTSDMCFGQSVKVINENEFDRYKRLIAVIVNQQNKNVNKELVSAGLAWHYKKYSTDTEYDELETAAKASKIGLWTEENPTPPWEWRHP
jgi:micrococcal nuclease